MHLCSRAFMSWYRFPSMCSMHMCSFLLIGSRKMSRAGTRWAWKGRVRRKMTSRSSRQGANESKVFFMVLMATCKASDGVRIPIQQRGIPECHDGRRRRQRCEPGPEPRSQSSHRQSHSGGSHTCPPGTAEHVTDERCCAAQGLEGRSCRWPDFGLVKELDGEQRGLGSRGEARIGVSSVAIDGQGAPSGVMKVPTCSGVKWLRLGRRAVRYGYRSRRRLMRARSDMVSGTGRPLAASVKWIVRGW